MSPPRESPPAANRGAITTTGQVVGTDNDNRSGRQAACTAPLIDKGDTLAHGRKHAPSAPIPPVGQIPDAATVFVGTVLWSSPADAAAVLELVADDDIEAPALSVVLVAVRRLAEAGKPCNAQIVMDELYRNGTVRRDVAKALMDATAAGAVPESARYYAAAVVGQALRRRVESVGHALQSAASTAPEADLAPMVTRAAAAVADCARRLAALRGEA